MNVEQAGAATITVDGIYRYDLTRRWEPASAPHMLWIMLNPSTADDAADDATMRRVITYTEREGYGGLVVVNLYALRATNPKQLRAHPDPIGPDNEQAIKHWLESPMIDMVVAAWGAKQRGVPQLPVSAWAEDAGRTLHCLGRTKDGRPRHPLYVKLDKLFEVYR